MTRRILVLELTVNCFFNRLQLWQTLLQALNARILVNALQQRSQIRIGSIVLVKSVLLHLVFDSSEEIVGR